MTALRTGRDPNGHPITSSQVGTGLEKLVEDTTGPAFSGPMLTALSPEGVRELEESIEELAGIAISLGAS